MGNHLANQFVQTPNSSIEGLPNELQDNSFLLPQAGITSISTESVGMGKAQGAILNTTVNFTVNNFRDFERIFNRYFLQLGVKLFVDFGWSTANLYDPAKLIENNDNIEEILYENDGLVASSNGDLEVVVGNVTDVDSKLNKNGTFSCSLTITSPNATIMFQTYGDGDNKISFS